MPDPDESVCKTKHAIKNLSLHLNNVKRRLDGYDVKEGCQDQEKESNGNVLFCVYVPAWLNS